MRFKPVHSGRLERYLGRDKVEQISRNFKDWYGPPVHLVDVPGSVRVCGGGDFIGPFAAGYAASALDVANDFARRWWREIGRYQPALAASGFASVSDALARASGGFQQTLGPLVKSGPTTVTNQAGTLWRLGSSPAAGSVGPAAPAGTTQTSANTGAIVFNNPSVGSLRLTGADFSSTVVNESLLIYDRLFSVAKTINSTATEAVTGVPTRFQNTTSTSQDYAGGNFVFPEVGGTVLAGTAHNWTVCSYRNQANSAANIPSIAGVSASVIDSLDLVAGSWFMPLAAGDSGILSLTQMQCSALVATGVISFVMGHPVGVMAFPVINSILPFNWLTSRNLAPYIPNNACLALLILPAPTTTAATFSGMLYGVSTSS